MARTRKVAAALGVVLATIALATSPVPAAPEPSRPASRVDLTWGPCPPPPVGELDPRQECALLAVP
ncbi:MAG: alpha/beta hydrolase, partial [Acidimicrobiales bacterium]